MAPGLPAGRALVRGQTIAVADVAECPEQDRAALRRARAPASCVPLPKARPSGRRFVLGETAPREWTPGEVALVEDAAKRAWVIVERARAEQALRAQEAEEREIAIGLQRALLPERLVALPELSFAALYEAGSDVLEVGGDWYDAFQLPSGRVALTVGRRGRPRSRRGRGDGTAAHGARGARTARERARRAAGAARRLPRTVARRPTSRPSATRCSTRPAASSSSPPQVTRRCSLVSPTGETRLLDDAQSPPLDGGDGRDRRQASVVLEPGSLLVLYSDGLVERRGEPLRAGLERLARGRQRPRRRSDRAGLRPARGRARRRVVACGRRRRARGAPDGGRASISSFRRAPRSCASCARRCARWLAERGVDSRAQNALLLAVGEACANAIEHAYRDRDAGEVSVDITEGADHALRVVVRDSGTFDATATSEDRGRGTDIMRALTTDFARDSTDGGNDSTIPPSRGEPDAGMNDQLVQVRRGARHGLRGRPRLRRDRPLERRAAASSGSTPRSKAARGSSSTWRRSSTSTARGCGCSAASRTGWPSATRSSRWSRRPAAWRATCWS